MNHKVLKRLSTVLSTLEANPQGLTARELDRITGYPSGQILSDLNDIGYYTELAGYYSLYPDDPEELAGENPANYSESMDDPVDYLVSSIDTRWRINAGEGPYPTFAVDLPEAVALLWLFGEYPPPEELKPLTNHLLAGLIPTAEAATAGETLQHLYTSGGVPVKINDHLILLRKALLQERKIRVHYYARGINQNVDWLLWPLGLVFYTGNGIWYLVACREDTGQIILCHLARIHQVQVLEQHFIYPADFSPREYLKSRWGMDTCPPETVRVRFYNEANVLEKVRQEFQARGLPAPKELPDGSLEYHGEIMGVNNFAKWVLSFGSSAEVLEPDWLRARIIEIARHWESMYRE